MSVFCDKSGLLRTWGWGGGMGKSSTASEGYIMGTPSPRHQVGPRQHLPVKGAWDTKSPPLGGPATAPIKPSVSYHLNGNVKYVLNNCSP